MGEIDDILRELERSLGPAEGPVTALDGGITNHNFRATLGGQQYVIRRHGRETELLGIDRDAERLASERAATLGIAPALVAALPDGLVTRYVACEPTSAADVARRSGEIGRALRRFHDSDVRLPVAFSVPDLLRRYGDIVRARGGVLPSAYAAATQLAARIVERRPAVLVPCHNDLLTGNLLQAAAGAVLIVDWEYAGMGDPFFDLGNLAVNNDFDDEAEDRLLHAYLDGPPGVASRAALKLMRVLSDAREAAWGVVQGAVSELDFDFAGYAARHFQRLQAAASTPQFEEWLAAA